MQMLGHAFFPDRTNTCPIQVPEIRTLRDKLRTGGQNSRTWDATGIDARALVFRGQGYVEKQMGVTVNQPRQQDRAPEIEQFAHDCHLLEA